MDNVGPLPKLKAAQQKKDGSPRGKGRKTIKDLFDTPEAGKVAVSKVQSELGEEDEATKSARMKHRAVVVRSVYSKARMSMVAMKHQGPLMQIGEQLEPLQEHSSSSRMKFMVAAKAIQQATRHTIMGRTMVQVFLDVASEAKEKARLKAEIDKLAREAEMNARAAAEEGDEEEPTRSACTFLTSLLEELDAAKKSRVESKDAVKFEALVQEMNEVMAKMNALKGLYAMNLQNANSVTGSMEVLQADIHRILASIGKSANELNVNIQGIGAEVAEELALARARSGHFEGEGKREIVKSESSTSLSSESMEHTFSEPPGLSRSSNSSQFSPLWRRAAIVSSFENMLVGALKDIQDAVTDVNQIARGTPLLSSALGIGVTIADDNLETPNYPSSPRGSTSGRSPRIAEERLSIQSRRSRSLLMSKALAESLKEASDEDEHSGPYHSQIGQPRIGRSSRESLYCPMSLAPEEFPAVAEAVVVPPSISRLLVDESSPLASRFKCPFAMLPLVVAPPKPKVLYKRRPLRTTRQAMKKKDSNLNTVEMVLAERVQRGIRDASDDFE